MRPLDYAKQGSGLRLNSPSRCQHIERRVLNSRHPLLRRSGIVQCALYRHVENIPHEWQGIKFGQQPKTQLKSTFPNRCTETEERVLTDKRIVRVRCSLNKNHTGKAHKHGQRVFGTGVQPRRPQNYRCKATERRFSEKGEILTVRCTVTGAADHVHTWMGRAFDTPLARRSYKVDHDRVA